MTAVASVPSLQVQRPEVNIARPAGPWRTFLAALFTFGLWPLLRWPRMWRQFIEVDRPRQISRAAAAKIGADDKQRRRIDRAVSHMTLVPILNAAPMVTLVLAVLLILTISGSEFAWSEIWELAYHPEHLVQWPISQQMLAFHSTWLTLLCVGYGCHWFVVRRYVFAVKDLDRAIGQRTLPRPSSGGPGARWVISAIPLCALGAWWAIPMVLAGSTQRRYSTVMAPAVFERPSVVRFCRTTGCGARLIESARYCPRCGTQT